MIFNADGRTTLAAATLFSFSADGDAVATKRCVQITPSGRPTVRTDGNRNGNCLDG